MVDCLLNPAPDVSSNGAAALAGQSKMHNNESVYKIFSAASVLGRFSACESMNRCDLAFHKFWCLLQSEGGRLGPTVHTL